MASVIQSRTPNMTPDQIITPVNYVFFLPLPIFLISKIITLILSKINFKLLFNFVNSINIHTLLPGGQLRVDPAPPYLICLAFSSFLSYNLFKRRMELITSDILISSDLDSSSIFPGSARVPELPACCSMNLKASHIIAKVSLRSSAIVIMASTPDWRQSCSMKAVPFLDSRSKEIDYSLHMWKNALYCIFEIPG